MHICYKKLSFLFLASALSSLINLSSVTAMADRASAEEHRPSSHITHIHFEDAPRTSLTITYGKLGGPYGLLYTGLPASGDLVEIDPPISLSEFKGESLRFRFSQPGEYLAASLKISDLLEPGDYTLFIKNLKHFPYRDASEVPDLRLAHS